MHDETGLASIIPKEFLPLNRLEVTSDRITLTDGDMLAQMLGRFSISESFLRSHISSTTTLLVGHSLADIPMRVLYQENAAAYPGHVHYKLVYLGEGALLSPEDREQKRRGAEELARAGSSQLSIISIPLFGEEFASFAQLLTMDEEQLLDLASEYEVPLVYRYYLVGAPGTGKSSILQQLASLVTHEEWPDPRPDELARDPASLTAEQKQLVDRWLNRQFRLKNRRLARAELGIHVVDRSPLDPLTYEDSETSVRARARELRRELRGSIVPGHVFRLVGREEVLALRLIPLQKELNAARIAKIAEGTDRLYSDPKVTIVDTRERDLLELVKLISHAIHMDMRPSLDLDRILQSYCEDLVPS